MITVVILTKNNSKTLGNTLESVRDFPEVIIYDTGSTDNTLSIASSFPNVTIVSGSLNGFGPTRNEAARHATYDWVLAIDSDEVVSKDLGENILRARLNPFTVYRFRRVNFFLGAKMRSCSGWGKDFVSRLYDKKHYSYSNDQVHEKIACQPQDEKLIKGELLHTPYSEIGDLLKKLHHYSDLFASQSYHFPNVPSGSVLKAVMHASFAFFKSYILKFGFLQGARGYIISCYIAHCCFYKYLKIWEKQFTTKKM